MVTTGAFLFLHPCSGIPINASTTAAVGSGVQLACNITGPVVWRKNGNPVMTSSRVVIGPQQKLYILSVQLGDEGEYGCDGGGRWMNTFLQVIGESTHQVWGCSFVPSPSHMVPSPPSDGLFNTFSETHHQLTVQLLLWKSRNYCHATVPGLWQATPPGVVGVAGACPSRGRALWCVVQWQPCGVLGG